MYYREKFISHIPFVVVVVFLLILLQSVFFFLCQAALEGMVLLEDFRVLATFLFTFCSLCRHSNTRSFKNIRWRGTV